MPKDFSIQEWPPKQWEDIYLDYEEHAAWYSGNGDNIAKAHISKAGSFWAKEITNDRKTMLHIPIAGDIASTSSDLLFGEFPNIAIENEKAKERLENIIQLSDVKAKLLEASETAAALGGIGLKINWNKNIADYPILSVAQADNIIPEWTHGILTAMNFWKVVKKERNNVYRLLERHEKGYIYNTLYKGTDYKIGNSIALAYTEETKDLEEEINTSIDDLLCRYIPNMRPNRKYRGKEIGQSDYAGVEGLMDALDEVYTSWMRDVRLAKARILVPESFLKKDETTGKFAFDDDKDVYVGLDVDPLSDAKITISQFDIRSQKHMETAYELLNRIITSAGYSPQSFGLKGEGGAMTATEIKARESKSFKTKAKKENYWKSPLEDILYLMLEVDNKLLGNKVVAEKPTLEFQDSIQDDLGEKATSVEMINRATAASIKTKVELLHPDWTDEQIETEVETIKEENGLSMPNPDDIGVA